MKATDAEVYVVVGACGFLGTALCKYLLDRNCVVVGLDIKLTNIVTSVDYRQLDVLDQESVNCTIKDIFRQYLKINGVISFAAQDFKIGEMSDNKNLDQEISVKNVSHDDYILSVNSAINLYNSLSRLPVSYVISLVLVGSDLAVLAPYQRLYRSVIDPACSKPISYSAVKHGMVGVMKYLATFQEEGRVRCNLLCPSGINDGSMSQEFQKALGDLNPMGRICKIEQICGPAYFLLSHMSSFVNGQTLVVDGGRTVW